MKRVCIARKASSQQASKLKYTTVHQGSRANMQQRRPTRMASSSSPLAALVVAALAAAAMAAASLNNQQLPGCQARCGQVEIPYPFGIANSFSNTGANCSLPGFEIGCVKGGGAPVAVLGGNTETPIQVLKLSTTPRPEARVMLAVAYTCYNATGYANGNTSEGTVDVNPAGVYRISNSSNELFVLGCNTLAYTKSGKGSGGRYSYTYYTGCVTYCNDSRSANDGMCAGIGCCHVDIPPGITDNLMVFGAGDSWSHDAMGFSPCDYAFIVERGFYSFRASDLTAMPVTQTLPVRLDWAIRNSSGSRAPLSCADAPKAPGYACVSVHSVCVNSYNGPGYVCNCTQGYEGNPYVIDGCTNIDECSRPREEFPCNGQCIDTEGSYDCKCRPGYGGNGDPKENPCNPKFSLAAKLSLGITLGVSFLIVALLLLVIKIQARRLDEYFKNNGGKDLEGVNGLTIYKKEELRKITNNNEKLIGKGSFGEVYRGSLPDEHRTEVAVKASIKVTENTKKEFTDEVKLQTKMIHRNILKLIGCCLHVKVPMLVYEFAANGSLHDVLHGKKTDEGNRQHKVDKLPLDLRLDIAIGSAEGLRYMHSFAGDGTIRHGDVKPDNILLDASWVPKLSDFGLARMIKTDGYVATKVIGCMGYIDPVFIKNGVLTQKSDVYSFGAVLLELISRRQIIYGENLSLIIEFRRVFDKDKSGRAMFDTEIAVTEEEISILEDIGRVAMMCLLEDDVDARPDMSYVLRELMVIRRGIEPEGKSIAADIVNEAVAATSGSGRSTPIDQ